MSRQWEKLAMNQSVASQEAGFPVNKAENENTWSSDQRAGHLVTVTGSGDRI